MADGNHLRYLSVCSGIEAATCAWHSLGWNPVAFSEIEKFPSAVLAHHYPSVPNLGDMTRFQEWPDDLAPDLIVGGTPCQSFSVAGLRGGLADPRGNLALVYLALADRYRPEWLVWENVPGVLSSNGGRDFGAFLGGLVELGYGFAYRVLDAQYFGVAQRRRRVFVVANARDWRRAAAVLFERHSLSGHPAPRRETGEGIAPTLAARTRGGGGLGTDFDCDGGLIPETCGALTDGAHMGGGSTARTPTPAASLPPVALCLNAGAMGRQDAESETLIPTIGGGFDDGHIFACAGCGEQIDERWGWGEWCDYCGHEHAPQVAHTLRAEGFDASEDGTGRGTPLVPITFGAQMSVPQTDVDMVQTLQAKNPMAVASGMAVRRLTPIECERLQGFPDDYTRIPWRGKAADACPDGPRYKALGNSMAVPCMAWIGRRIAAVAAQSEVQEAA